MLVYFVLEAVSKSEFQLVVLQVDCCPPVGWVGVAWPGLEHGEVVTAGVKAAGGQPPMTDEVGERNAFAIKAFTNGGRTPLLSPPTFAASIDLLSGEGR